MIHSTRARRGRPFFRPFELCVVLACSVAGCKQEPGAPAPSASPTPSESQRTAAVAPSAPEPQPAPEVPTMAPVPPLQAARCRVLRVKGSVKRASGAALATMMPVEGDAWLELAPGSELVVRHSVSARELLLRGPGNMLPCRGGQEQVLIESGALTSASGTGVRPGAEVWVGTPFGTARYGDAAFDLTVGSTHWKVVVKSGSVWTDPPLTPRGRSTSSRKPSPTRADEGRVQGGEQASSAGKPNPDSLLGECRRLADEANAGAERVVSGAPGLGERAAEHLLQRKRARAACLSAAAAARRVADAARRSRLEDQIRAADAVWERVPPPLTVSGPRR